MPDAYDEALARIKAASGTGATAAAERADAYAEALKRRKRKDGDTEPESESSAVGRIVRNALKGTSYGLAAQAAGAVGPPEETGPVGGVASEVLSWLADPLTYGTGGVGTLLAKQAGKGIVRKGVQKAVQGSVAAGTQLGAMELVKDPLRRAATGQEQSLVGTLGAAAQGAGAGALFGPASVVPTLPGRLAAEVAAVAAPSVVAGEPVGESLLHAAGVVGGFKLSHAATRALAALAGKPTVSRKEYMEATGVKQADVPPAAERKAQADAAAEQVRQETENAPESRKVEVGDTAQRLGDDTGGTPAGPSVRGGVQEGGQVAPQEVDLGAITKEEFVKANLSWKLNTEGERFKALPPDEQGRLLREQETRDVINRGLNAFADNVYAEARAIEGEGKTKEAVERASDALDRGKAYDWLIGKRPQVAPQGEVGKPVSRETADVQPTRFAQAAEAAKAKADAAYEELQAHRAQGGQTLFSTGVDPKAIEITGRWLYHEAQAAGYSFADYVARVVQRVGKSAVALKQNILDAWERHRASDPKIEAAGDIDAIIARTEAPDFPTETSPRPVRGEERLPELAIPTNDPTAQGALRAADEIRTAIDEPRRVTHKEADAVANQRLAEQGSELTRRLVEEGWVPQDSPDTFAQIKILGSLGRQAAESRDWESLIKASINYRQGRTQTAQALEAGKSAIAETLTPGEQQAYFNQTELAKPPPAVEMEIVRAKERERQEAPEGFKLEGEPRTARERRAREARKARSSPELVKKWSAEVEKLRAKLAGLGHDVDKALKGELDPIAQREFIRDVHALKATKADQLYEWWNNAILSGPATQVTNAIGNVAHAGWHFTAERIAQTFIDSIARGLGYKVGGARFGELRYIAKAMVDNWGQAAKNFFETWHSEVPQFYRQRGLEEQTAYGYRPGSIPGKFGKAVRMPWRMLAAVDDFVKWQTYEMERAALAYRQAKGESLEGDKLVARMGELLRDPGSTVNKAATDTAIRLAFQESTKFAKGAAKLIHDIPGGRYLLPFITTPFNIVKTGIRKSPFGSLKLAQEIFKASRSGDWSHVSPRAAEQVLAWGATLALAYSNDPADPWITGGEDRNRKYSIKIGGQWYSYSRIEPFATTLGLLVDGINKVHQGQDVYESLKAPFDALLGRIEDQTFFTGISDLMKAARYQDAKYVADWAAKFPASWVPNLVRAPLRAMADEVPERRIWGASDTERADRALRRGLQAFEVLPDHPKWDLWGRPVPKDGSPIPHTDWIWRTLSPVGERRYVETIGDRMLTRWNAAHPEDRAEFRPPNTYFIDNGKTFSFTDAEYEQYVRESGRLTQQRIIAQGKKFNMENPTERDIERLRKIIETSRTRVRNSIKRARRKAERQAA